MDETVLRALIDLRDRTIQKNRIAFSNRMFAIEQGVDVPTNGSEEILKRWLERFSELEVEAEKDIKKAVKGVEIIDRMIEVKGVGPMLSAKVVSMIDINRADTISALWRYAGYAVVDGAREKPTKGERLHYNARLKTTCYLVGSSFLKSGSPYRKVYDDSREYYEANRPDWTKAHQHNAAMRRMIKLWLSHLWLEWRKVEGLDTRQPFVQERLGHGHIIAPQEMGWPN